MLHFALDHAGPASLRYPKANLEKVERAVAPIELGQAEVYEWGDDGMLVAYGTLFPTCVKAAETLREEGIDVGVINARFAKPLDRTTLLKAVEEVPLVVTVEEGTLEGGFGSASLEAANAAGLDTRACRAPRPAGPLRRTRRARRTAGRPGPGRQRHLPRRCEQSLASETCKRRNVMGYTAEERGQPPSDFRYSAKCGRVATTSGTRDLVEEAVAMRIFVLGNAHRPGVREEADRLLPLLRPATAKSSSVDLSRRPTSPARRPIWPSSWAATGRSSAPPGRWAIARCRSSASISASSASSPTSVPTSCVACLPASSARRLPRHRASHVRVRRREPPGIRRGRSSASTKSPSSRAALPHDRPGPDRRWRDRSRATAATA